MTITETNRHSPVRPAHSPTPWEYEYNPYTVRAGGDGAETELPAFEVFDDHGNKVFDTNEDAPAAEQEANARIAVGAPALLAACRLVIERWEHGDLAEAARACAEAVALVMAA
jgi:hypothetical protein